ncbi:hypothetical protein [Sphingosinithalassobacter sp. LHW66-3]|uniref:hypothetical protein n=1 Tax=Sphingosinithalassobacter sp. LHW66-3 TaxID=3424718 RepID=UPI003D6C3E36
MAARVNREFLRLLAVLLLTCAAGWFFKSHCMAGGWTDLEQYTTGCYSDAVPFWGGRGVAAGEAPYFQARMEYPVLTGALIWAEGGAARLVFGGSAGAIHFLGFVTLANTALAALLLYLFWCEGLDRRRLWAWAAAPPLILYVGHNWDMLAVGFAAGAMLLARRGALARAAAVAGLGVAAKLFPILLLPLLGLQALFGGTRSGWGARLLRASALAAAAVGAWALVNLPVALAAPENWSEFYRFSGARSGTAASAWEIFTAFGWWRTTIPERNLLAAMIFLTGASAIVALGWRRHRERLWVLFPPVLAWFMLTNKVYSPQFDLWLYPLLLLTAPRLWPVALFLVGGIWAYFAEFWWFAGIEGAALAASHADIALAALLRGGAMLWLIADALRLPPPQWLSFPRQRLQSAQTAERVDVTAPA